MSNETDRAAIAVQHQSGFSRINGLVNLAGFWMAVFSLAGLVMLAIAGPVIQKRMTRRVVTFSESVAGLKTTTGEIHVGEKGLPTGASKTSPNEYSLDGLRWALAGCLVAGVLWTGIAISKSEGKPVGQVNRGDGNQ